MLWNGWWCWAEYRKGNGDEKFNKEIDGYLKNGEVMEVNNDG